jgi:hypothetical protein
MQNMVALFLFLKGMTGALAPLSSLVSLYFLTDKLWYKMATKSLLFHYDFDPTTFTKMTLSTKIDKLPLSAS